MRQLSLGDLEGRGDAFDVAESGRFRSTLRRSWPLVAAIALPLTALVLVVSLLLPPTYRASATIVLDDRGTDSGDSGLVGRELETLERLVTTQPVLAGAAQRLGVTPESLSDKVSASASPEANIVLVTAEDGDAAGAARIANAVAETFLAQRASASRRALAASRASLESRIARLRGSGRQGVIESLREALRELAVDEARGGPVFVLAEPARVPDAPDSPRVLQNTLFALFGFVFIAVLIALAKEQIAPRVQDATELASLIGAPLLLEMPVPRSGRTAPAERGPYELVAESVRELDDGRAVLVTTPRSDPAQETIAAGLARSLASTGEKVALVVGTLESSRPVGTDELPAEDELDDLNDLADVGPGATTLALDEATRFNSRAELEAFVDRLAEHDVRHVVIVGRPLLAAGDGLLQASLSDCVVLVCRTDRTSRDDAARLGRQLRAAGVHVLGIVALGGKQVVPYRSPSSLEQLASS
jgi:capsular polysaccharide biosynthesis protein